MPKAGLTHNISFSIGGTEYGFQLAKDNNGKLAYNRSSLNLLPNASPFTGANLSDANPEKIIVRDQKSFKGGVSQNWLEYADRYYYANGVDASIDGYLALAPLRLNEYRPTITNGAFSPDLTGWVVGGSTPALSGGTITWDGTQSAGTITQGLVFTTANIGQPFIAKASLAIKSDIHSGSTATLSVSTGTTVVTATTILPAGANVNSTITIAEGLIIPAGSTTLSISLSGNGGNLKQLNITNPGYTGLTGWTVTGSTPTVSGGSLQYVGSSGTISQGLAFSAGDIGRYIYVSVPVTSTTTTTNARLTLDFGGSTITDTVGGDGTLTYSSTIPPTANTIIIRVGGGAPAANIVYLGAMVADVESSYVKFSNVSYGTPMCFEQFGGKLYAGVDGALLALGTNNEWTFQYGFSSNITDIASWGNYLHIAPDGQALRYSSSPSSAWSTSTSITSARHLGVCDNKLVASTTVNAIKYLVTPGSDAGCVSITGIGDTSSTITSIPDHPLSIIICKTDAVYTINSSTIPEVYMDFSAERNADTGKGAYYWHNALYIPTGNYGLWQINDDGVATNISPTLSANGQDIYRKQVQAMTGDGTWLDVFSEDSTITRHMRGRQTADGWVWQDTGADASVDQYYDANIYVWNGYPYLFTATDLGINYLYHKRAYDVPIEPNYRMVSDGTIYGPRHDLGFRNSNKAYYSITITGEPQANSTITVYYTTNDVTWTAAGTITSGTAAAYPYTIYFPSSTTASYIRPRFDFHSSSATITPYMSSYSITGQLLEDKKSVWDIGLMLTPESIHRKSGATERINVPTAVAAINTGINSNWPVTFYDIDGSTHYVVMRLNSDQMVEDPANNQISHYMSLNLQEVEWST